MSAGVDYSREACEWRASILEGWTADGVSGDAQKAAALILALRAALDAAERRAARIEAAWQEDGGRYWEARYRDEAALNENLAAINAGIKAERDAADALRARQAMEGEG